MKSSFTIQLNRGQKTHPWLLDEAKSPDIISEAAVGDISLIYRRSRNTIEVRVPFVTTDQLYYRRTGDTLVISDDLRHFYRRDNKIDHLSLYSLLQFGATVPPLTIWQDVREFTPGFAFTIDLTTLRIDEADRITQWPRMENTDPTLDVDSQIEILTDIVDASLRQACPSLNPVILFSGGIDSGLLAARAAVMGWKGATLVNYGFGQGDKESALAERMASHLGLRLIQIHDTDRDPLEVLDRVASDYPAPFGDPSTLPTSALAKAVAERFTVPRTILDGTGADGTFGLFGKVRFYQSLYRVPRPLRFLLGETYPFLFRRNVVSLVERAGRIVRRSAHLPLLSYQIAQNPLCGISYHPCEDDRIALFNTISEWIDATVSSNDSRARIPALDVAFTCTRIRAQKVKPIFDTSHHAVVFPFLSDLVTGFAVGRARHWPGSNHPKKALKSMLAKHVPSEMVYRPKSGFDAPYHRLFAEARFVSAFDRLLSGDTIFEDLVDFSLLRTLRKRIVSGERLPEQTYWFLWVAIFTDSWISQLDNLRPT